jgi:voltage-gated potassium channel
MIVVSLVVVVEGVLLWSVTPSGNVNISNPIDGIYFIIPIFFGETTAPQSTGERIVTLIALAQGLILTTYLIVISAFFSVKGGQVLTKEHSNHYAIFGWNFQGTRVINELIEARAGDHFDIVVVPGHPVPNELKQFGNKISVIEGAPAENATLLGADIMTAKSAIILNDTTDSPESADARVLMITLAIESMNPAVYTCAQVQHSSNEIHLQRANVDETIPLDMIGANLAVSSALHHGVTKMISELVHFDSGSEIYKMVPPLPASLVGLKFADAQTWFASHDMILVGIESERLSDSYTSTLTLSSIKSRGVAVNPHGHAIELNDALFVISQDAPDPEHFEGLLTG